MKSGHCFVYIFLCIIFALLFWDEVQISEAIESNLLFPARPSPHHHHHNRQNHNQDGTCERRKELAVNRKCLKRCLSDKNCRGRSRKCVCDDVCGKSCVKLSQKCETVKLLFNGKFQITPFNTFGADVEYFCYPGFRLVGDKKRICQGDGYWSGEAPTCQPDSNVIPTHTFHEVGTCSDPPVITHATHDASPAMKSFPLGTQLTYSCSNGFKVEGGFRAMCVGQGRWVGLTMTCQPKQCGHPGEAPNARREGDVFVYPNKVKYTCAEGYELIGRANLVCQTDGRWSSSLPTCKPVPCPKLLPPINGVIIGSDFTYGSVVKFSCEKGFVLEGPVTRKCQSNGRWSDRSPTCAIVDCGTIGPLYNGYLGKYRTTYGSSVNFTCFGNTNFEGVSKAATCLDGGNWSQPVPKCWNKCQIPKIANGSLEDGMSIGEYLNHTGLLQYKCDSGFTNKSSEKPLACFNGTWSRKPVCHPAPCGRRPPEVKDGIVRFHTFEHGSRAKYMCNTGFKISGVMLLTCQFGSWKGKTPTCEEVHCKYPGAVPNGQILLVGTIGKYDYSSYAKRIGHNQQIEYQCGKDYVLVGPAAATCVDGEWSPPNKPECLPKQHPRLLVRTNKG